MFLFCNFVAPWLINYKIQAKLTLTEIQVCVLISIFHLLVGKVVNPNFTFAKWWCQSITGHITHTFAHSHHYFVLNCLAIWLHTVKANTLCQKKILMMYKQPIQKKEHRSVSMLDNFFCNFLSIHFEIKQSGWQKCRHLALIKWL